LPATTTTTICNAYKAVSGKIFCKTKWQEKGLDKKMGRVGVLGIFPLPWGEVSAGCTKSCAMEQAK